MPILVPYVVFCIGCALVQLGYLNFPPAQARVAAANVSILELTRPSLYYWLSFLVNVGALASAVGEIWVGVRLFSWWPGLVVFIPVTVVVDLVAGRVSTPTAILLGVTFGPLGTVGMVLAQT